MNDATELRIMLRLAGPLILGYAGSQLMSMTDTAMVGRLGASALAGVSVGNGVYFTVSCSGSAASRGSKRRSRKRSAPASGCARAAFVAGRARRARRVAAAARRDHGAVAAGVAVGRARSRDLARSRRVHVGAHAQRHSVSRLQRAALVSAGVGITRPIIISTVAGLIANAAGNYLFIYVLGLGVAGSGIASTLAATAMVLALAPAVAAVDTPPDPERRTLDRALVRTILRLGVPNGGQVVAEVGVFATVGILAGRIGAASAAAHLVAITLASFTFCVTLGIGAATSVRVGHHVGAGDTGSARHAGLIGLGASSAFMTTSALVFFSCAPWLAAALTDDASVLAVAVPLVHVAAIFQLSRRAAGDRGRRVARRRQSARAAVRQPHRTLDHRAARRRRARLLRAPGRRRAVVGAVARASPPSPSGSSGVSCGSPAARSVASET